MMTGVRALLLIRWSSFTTSLRGRSWSRQQSARATLTFGLVSFLVANAGLAAVVESKRPEWRDPEFGYRILQLKHATTITPRRPLVLAFGSSRVQQGLDPGVMGFDEGSNDPLVFNFGYRGAGPVIAARNYFRLRAAGIRPDYVLIEFSSASAAGGASAAGIVMKWPDRFTVADMVWLRESGFLNFREGRTAEALTSWMGAIALPWTSHRQVLTAHWMPQWVTETQWKMVASERMDWYGFTEMQADTTTTELYRRDPAAYRERFARKPASPSVAVSAQRAYSLLIDHCHRDGIPVAVVWTPLAPLLTGWVNTELQSACTEFTRELTRERGVPVFPPPDWLGDDDFADGQHLLPHAAAKYSRWLADTHLKPWLIRNGVAR